ncbi:MAG TPA: nucleotidyltransferase domain-containing protein [Thermoanaerobaculia bacterium]|jgi:predicted nucleotidyltransferase|nr:nucleotidyltransferase domain-containing protein [Thermoanaerobaculia bacterium]
MNRRAALAKACAHHGVAAVYLFGSRADDGLAVLDGAQRSGSGSDLDIGLLFAETPAAVTRLAQLQIAFEDVFAPLRIDIVPLDRVDPIFQFRAIDGHRVFAQPSRLADLFELEVMRSAAELLPIQRERERERFGVSTT